MTALHWAAEGNYEPVVRLLLKKGASANAVNGYGHAVLLSALGSCSTEHSHEPMMLDGVREITERTRKPVVELLLENGAETSVKTKKGETVLHYAIQYSWKRPAEVAVVQLLLEKEIDITARDSLGTTALSKATVRNNEAAVRLLLEHGADVNMRHWYAPFTGVRSWNPPPPSCPQWR